MIISRAPVRVSFFGGGSDIPDFYREHGGAVISTAINKFIFVTINAKFDNRVRVAYSRTEDVGSAAQVEHPLVRAALQRVGIEGGVEITTVADIPSRGTGLGSSSSLTVALLNGLYAFRNRYVSAMDLGAEASHIEIDICREPIGKQDQYAAAVGGFNLLEFMPDDTVVSSPLVCSRMTRETLENNLLMLYTGITRSASALLAEQSADIKASADKRLNLKRMVRLCFDVRSEIQNDNLIGFGEALHESWMLKKSLTANISNSDIDEWYDKARIAGAVGGKILGAGAGGFLLLYAPLDRHGAICHALPNLRQVPFRFESTGSQIVFYQPNS